jgi:type II secretory pathway pseudopilin PulG
MLIVVVIIGILASALIPRISSAKDRAQNTAAVKDVSDIVTALTIYQIDNG